MLKSRGLLEKSGLFDENDWCFACVTLSIRTPYHDVSEVLVDSLLAAPIMLSKRLKCTVMFEALDSR